MHFNFTYLTLCAQPGRAQGTHFTVQNYYYYYEARTPNSSKDWSGGASVQIINDGEVLDVNVHSWDYDVLPEAEREADA